VALKLWYRDFRSHTLGFSESLAASEGSKKLCRTLYHNPPVHGTSKHLLFSATLGSEEIGHQRLSLIFLCTLVLCLA
jgi:hypothetical protein